MKNLVFAELVDGATDQMTQDPKVYILSDTGLFLVTTPEYASTYPELEFLEVDEESYDLYNLKNVFNFRS